VRMRVPYKSALGVVGLAAVALALVYWRFADQPASAPAAASPVPVVTAQVQRHDEPIVLSGLGTVQALNTASIQSQGKRDVTAPGRYAAIACEPAPLHFHGSSSSILVFG
jgi:multidrug efflux pump subunit AcrA (membrane-fusion protein)